MITSLTSFFVTFREGFEAVVLSMLMLGVGRSQGMRNTAMLAGIALGLSCSVLLLAIIHSLDLREDLLGGVMNAVTAIVLTYVVLLNARVGKHIREHLDQIRNRGLWAVVFTIATIYFREGAEIVLLLYGPVTQDPLSVIVGASLGLAILAAVLYAARRRISMAMDNKTMFLVSNIMLGALAIFFYVETLEFVLENGWLIRH